MRDCQKKTGAKNYYNDGLYFFNVKIANAIIYAIMTIFKR